MKILISPVIASVFGVVLAALGQAPRPLTIKSFSVGHDQTLTYPDNPANPPYLVDLPDEHTTVIPPSAPGSPYLVFAASKLSGGTGGAVVLQTTDLSNFDYATTLGYNRQVFASPIPINQCNSTYTTEFDGNYAAPGSVVQDPTLPPGNMIIIYEAENHCPGSVYNPEYYATVGFARSSDNGKSWPAPVNGPMGGPSRHPILQSSIPQPSTPHPPEGNAIPSAFIDVNANGDYYLYVTYENHSGMPSDNLLRVARAKLGADPLTFSKWYNGAFSQPGIGGSDSGVMPLAGCSNGRQAMGEISRNDDLGLYLMMFVCVSGGQGSPLAAWYYSTATSLDLQDWSGPKMIQNSQSSLTSPCANGRGQAFDGWYPSSMSPGAPAGHTKLTGLIFFQNGCDTGPRIFMSRTFTIATGPATPVLNSGSLGNGATYVSGGLVPGSWAQVKGSALSGVTRIWDDADFVGLGNKLPTNLSGVQVNVDNLPAAVYYIDAGQVNFQVPAGITGSASVQVVNNGAVSNAVTAAAATNSPGIFPIIVNGTNYPAGVFLDGKYVGDPAIGPAFRKAKPGDVIQLYATGLVPTPAGVLPTPQAVSGVTVTIGTVTVPADFAGLVAVGEFQINFKVPQEFANRAEGVYPISIQVNGVSSPLTINSNPPGPLVVPIQH